MQNPPSYTPKLPHTPQQSGIPTPPVIDQTYQQPPHLQQPKPKHGRLGRFFRGYLMLVGALTTLYVLVQALVRLFIEIGKWTSTVPMA